MKMATAPGCCGGNIIATLYPPHPYRQDWLQRRHTHWEATTQHMIFILVEGIGITMMSNNLDRASIILRFMACHSINHWCCNAYSQNEQHSIPVTCVTAYAIACVSCCNVGCRDFRFILIEISTCNWKNTVKSTLIYFVLTAISFLKVHKHNFQDKSIRDLLLCHITSMKSSLLS